jgi:hypothetical protein
MRPPACVSCKWGTGTVCEKPTNSVSRKEMDAKLKEMMAAREKQDAKWFAPPTEQSKSTNDYTAQSIYSSEILQNKRK